MSCWVVPSIAAELWGVPVEQVMRHVHDGLIPTLRERGFLFVDVAPAAASMTACPDADPPATYTLLSEAEEDALSLDWVDEGVEEDDEDAAGWGQACADGEPWCADGLPYEAVMPGEGPPFAGEGAILPDDHGFVITGELVEEGDEPAFASSAEGYEDEPEHADQSTYSDPSAVDAPAGEYDATAEGEAAEEDDESGPLPLGSGPEELELAGAPAEFDEPAAEAGRLAWQTVRSAVSRSRRPPGGR